MHFPLAFDLVFRHPSRFWWASVFALVFLLVLLEGRKRAAAFQHPWIALHSSTSNLPNFFARLCWWTCWTVATILLVAAYANPERVFYDWERVFERIRISFILDISHSMKKAEDVLPNRLEAEKGVVRDFAAKLEQDKELKGKYSLALIPFSGAALPYYLPFTTSRDEFLAHLDAMDTDTVNRKGTSLWAAIRAFDELLLAKPASDKGTVDLGILISDGGKEEGKKERALIPRTIDELRDPYRAPRLTMSGERVIVRARESQRKVVLNTVGIGKIEINEGRRVPYPARLINRDKAGNFMGYDHVKEDDSKGPVLTTMLDEQILSEVAVRGGGVYRHFYDHETILQEFKAFVLANRVEVDKIPVPRYESVRAWFLVPAFIMYYFLFGYGVWMLRFFSRILRVNRRSF
ncbi:MAG: VWA domain-containing protein [bacterium]|nr:VWA domain-containing protein [bacterium]